jgi:uncharacterized repeat protein (TIGR01451 family)
VTGTQFISNTASVQGGGLYTGGTATATGAQFIGNTAMEYGGGLSTGGMARVTSTLFISNTATTQAGGGLFASSATTTGTQFIGNTAATAGGGLYTGSNGTSTVNNTMFTNNTATNGGGMSAGSTSTVNNTMFTNNTATNGGGAYFTMINPSTKQLVNVLLARNTATGSGGGIYVANATLLRLVHTTIASPTVGAGAAIYVAAGTVNLANTLIASYTTGIQRAGGTVSEDYGLFEAVATPYSGEITTGGHSLTGTAAFVGPAADNYRLTSASAAIDRGTNAGVTADLADVPRPQGAGFDIGAYEAYLPKMVALGNGAIIANGDATPSPLDHTDFGSAPVGGAITRTFTLSNSGAADLNLTGSPLISLTTGPAAGDFSVVSNPITPVSPNSVTTFEVRFAPSMAGTRVATVTIASDDPADNPYTFAMQGMGILPPQLLTVTPPRNAITAPLNTLLTATYDQAMAAASFTSRTLVIHGMQGGLATAGYSLVNSRTVAVTPSRPFHQGELVYAIATTATANLIGTDPLTATQWSFNTGVVSNRCVGGFTDIGAGLPGVSSSSVAWGDYDNDGDLDILLMGWTKSGHIARVYRNTGGSFSDIGAGLPRVMIGSAAWGDYDNDGDLDILLTGNTESGQIARVYRNTNGSFSDIGAGLPVVCHSSAAWGDYDNDGDLDILLTGNTGSTYITRVYRNTGGNFTDIGANLSGVDLGSSAWGDYDNDGDLDILLTGTLKSGGHITRVYRNTGGNFTDIGAGLPGVSGNAAWGDYDNDGDLDILLTGWTVNGFIARVYRNTGGSFNDIGAGLRGVSGNAAWGDYDNDGDLDILLTGKTANDNFDLTWIYRNTGGNFNNIEAKLPGLLYSSTAWGDYDNDGDLDILLTGLTDWTEFDGLALIYRNEDCTDLTLSQRVTPARAQPGQLITYTLAFSNAGTGLATDVRLTDTIPATLTGVSVQSAGAAITNTGHSPAYVWQVQNLAPGAGGVITLTGQISPGLTGNTRITNTATLTGTGDIAPGNNSASAGVTVNVPTIAFSRAAYSVTEDVGQAVITVSLSAAPFAPVMVNYASSDDTAMAGSDYTAVSGTATVLTGTTIATFTIPITDDLRDEPAEALTITLNSTAGAALTTPHSARLTLTDNDDRPSVTLALSGSPIEEASGIATVTAQLSAESGQDVTVTLAYSGMATHPGDYSRSGVSILIPAGELTGTATLTATQDSLDEPTETIIVDISAVTNGTEDGLQQVVASLPDDDDPPSVTVDDVTVDEGGGQPYSRSV